MITRFLRFILGVLLIPFSIGISLALYQQLGSVHTINNYQLFFLYGLGSYIILHLVFYRPVFPYVFGHELMHALSTWISGGQVKSFKASAKGGEVKTTKSNSFISLSPYCFPLYTIVLALAYSLSSLFFEVGRYVLIFIFLVGFTLAFHLVITIDFLKTKQPDLVKTGYILSLSLIYMVNLSILALILSLIFPDISFLNFIQGSFESALNI
jgi:hypothetical protein